MDELYQSGHQDTKTPLHFASAFFSCLDSQKGGKNLRTGIKIL